MFSHNPQKVVFPHSPGLQPAQAMLYCIRKDMSSRAMSDLGFHLQHCCERGTAETGKAGMSLPHLCQLLAFDHIMSPNRPHHLQPQQCGYSILPCLSSGREGTWGALELVQGSVCLGRAWSRAGTNLILTALESNQRYLGPGRRCP